MLKIEADAKKSIAYRTKEQLFSTTLVLAFLIAALLHLSGYLLIAFKDHTQSHSSYRFPFVSVAANIDPLQNITTSATEDLGEHSPPPRANPQMPALEDPHYKASHQPIISPFMPKELLWFEVELPFEISPLLSYSPSASIHLIGEGADQVMIINQAFLIDALIHLQHPEGTFRFEYLFDPQHQRLIAPIDAQDQEIASLLLEHLRLETVKGYNPHRISLEVQLFQRGQYGQYHDKEEGTYD